MLSHIKAVGSYSIKDPLRTKDFYEKILGLTVEEKQMPEGPTVLTLETEGTRFMLYEKPDHAPATFTVLNFPVSDIESEVENLTKKGVKFEHYEGNDENEINRNCGGPPIAWFKDPSGNFLSLMQTDDEVPPSPS